MFFGKQDFKLCVNFLPCNTYLEFTSISKPAFWFLLVSEPQKPIKTRKPGNLETQVPFPRKLTCLHIQKNIRNQQKP